MPHAEGNSAFDPFLPSNGREDYTPESTPWTRATDDKGHSHEVRVRFDPDQWARVCEMADRIPGYRTPQDAIRDAVGHRLYWWADGNNDHDVLRSLDVWRIASKLDADLERATMMHNLCDRCEHVADHLSSIGDTAGAQHLLTDVRLEIALDSGFWTEPYRTRMLNLCSKHGV